MLATTFSALLHGLETIKITIEIALTQGLPTLQIVGLPSQTVAESKERITAALISCGIKPKAQRTVVNLAPADIRKTSSAFELPIAAGLLQLYGVIPPVPSDTLLLGELSLTGELKPITGALPLILGAQKMGFKQVVLPTANSDEAALVHSITCIPVENVQQFIQFFKKEIWIEPVRSRKAQHYSSDSALDLETDLKAALFEEIVGQEQAKRALEIAAAGGHNLYLVGPPGTGKSMLAESFAALLPPLEEAEALEVYSLHSIAGKLTTQQLSSQRPFRKIHHTTSQVGLIGGGTQLIPGEISLAHRGVLFMDELPEFPRFVLESLRQPLESKTINLSRASGTVQYPANFTLVAAANPCPCGYKGSQKRACVCSEYHQQQYQAKISGPLLDRIDLKVWVGEVSIMSLGQKFSAPTASSQQTTEQIRSNIKAARQLQKKRFIEYPHLSTNADMSTQEIKKFCKLEPAARHLLIKKAEAYNLSARQYFRVIKVAQTVADLNLSEEIKSTYIGEALEFSSIN
jgi:magnesium chelatase family protein